MLWQIPLLILYTASMQNRRWGLSLLEAVIALFLLIFGVLVVIRLLHQATRYDSEASRLAVAVRVSENALAEARAWAADPTNFDSAWSGFPNPYIDPNWPQYPVDITVATPPSTAPANELFSPSRDLEAAFPSGDRRILTRSLATLQTQCRYGPRVTDVLVLTTNIGEPDRVPRAVNPIVANRSGSPDPVPQNGVVGFETNLIDSSNTPIPDMMFFWTTHPVTRPGLGPGAGTLQGISRNGKTANLKHIYIKNPVHPDTPPDNPIRWHWVGGLVGVTPRARYKGVFYPDAGAPAVSEVQLVDVP